MSSALLMLSLLVCMLIWMEVNAKPTGTKVTVAKPTDLIPIKFDVVFTKGSRADGWDTGLFKVVLEGSVVDNSVESENDPFY